MPRFASTFRFSLIAATLLILPAAARAAAITWGPATTIAGDTDAFNVGASAYAFDWSGSTQTINGVTFTGTTTTTTGVANLTLSSWDNNNTSAFNSGSNPFNSLSSAYKNILRGADFNNSNTTGNVTLNNLTIGHVYAVQFWVSDPRSLGGNLRADNLTGGGGNTVNVRENVANAEGSPGQYSIGGFTADGTTQAFTATGTDPGTTQMNALQVRDVTGVWSGAANGNWDSADANFTGGMSFNNAAITSANRVSFADTDGFNNAVTNTTVAVQTGGVSIGTVNLQNNSLNYTFTSGDANGITGATAVNKTGTGTVTFAGPNTYTGSTTVSAGTLRLQDTNAIQNSTLVNGGTGIVFDASVASHAFTVGELSGSGNLSLQDNATNPIVLSAGNNNTDATYSGALSGGGGLTKVGSGTLTLSGVNTFAGATTVGAGTLVIGAAGSLGSGSYVGPIVNNGTLRYSSSAPQSFSGGLSGNGALIKDTSASSILTISGANPYTGSIAVSAGKLYLNGTIASSAIGVGSGGTLGGTGSASAATATVAAGGAIEAGSGGAGQLTLAGLTFSGPGAVNFGTLTNYSAAPGLQVTGSGLLNPGGNTVTINVGNLSGAVLNTPYQLIGYSGSIPGGSTAIQLAPLPNRATGTLSDTGSQIDLTITSSSDFLIWTGAGNLANGWDTTTQNWKLNSNGNPTAYINNPGDIVVFDDSANPSNTTVSITAASVSPTSVTFNNSTDNYTITGTQAITGTTGLTKSGTGVLTISTANTYTGTTTLNGGVLNLGKAEVAGTSGPLGKSAAANPGSIVLNGGTLQYSSNNSNDYSGRFSTAANQAYNVDTNGVNVTWATALTSAGGALTKSGLGTLTLTANETYTGATTIGAGSLRIGNGGSGASLNGTSSITDNGNLTFNTSDSVTPTVAVGGSGSLTQAGGGALTLGVANSYSGGTTLSGGTLNIGLAAAIPAGPLTLSGGTLDNTSGAPLTLAGNPPTINGSFTFAGAGDGSHDLNLGSSPTTMSNNPTITVNAGTLTIGNIAGGTSSLSKSGGGTLTLTGNNVYTGSTNVNSGTLNLNGIHTAPSNLVTNNDGSVLNINGTETVTPSGQFVINFNTSGTATVNVAGTLNLNSDNTTLIGQENFGTAVLNILSGGTINVTTGEFRLGNTSSQAPTAILTMSPGSQLNFDGNQHFVIANGGSSTSVRGTLNLNGGVLTTARGVQGGIGTATFNFNGGTLRAGETSPTFFSLGSNGASRANVENGGAIIDTNSFDDTIGVPLLHSNIAGDNAIDGGLTKNGVGTLTLSGTDTYTGPTTVNGGTLRVAGSLANNGPDKVFVAAGTDFTTAVVVRTVASSGGSYLGLGSTAAGAAPGLVGTSAVVLAGVNSGAFTGGQANVSMAWRTRTAQEAAAPPLVSDVINLTGMTGGTDPSPTDPFALQMTYSPSLLGDTLPDEVAAGKLFLGWLNPNAGSPQWQNAIAGDTGNNATPSEQNFPGSFASFQALNGTDLSSYVGAWGVDASSNAVWAVVDHNSQFAVVPEPSSLLLAGLGSLGLLLIRRRAGQGRNRTTRTSQANRATSAGGMESSTN